MTKIETLELNETKNVSGGGLPFVAVSLVWLIFVETKPAN